MFDTVQNGCNNPRKTESMGKRQHECGRFECLNVMAERYREQAMNTIAIAIATVLALAAAGKVVGSSMTGDTQRRLVEDFLKESTGSSSNASRN